MRLRALAAAGLLLLALPRPASAEWHFTPMAGGTFFGDTSLLDLENAAGSRHRTFGGSVSLLGGGLLGAEILGLHTPGFFEGDLTDIEGRPLEFVDSSRAVALMGNIVVTAPRRWTEYSLRPFVSGGFGLLHASMSDVNDALPFSSNLAGFNIGGGAVGFLSQRTGIRFDVRYFSTLRGEDDEAAPSFGRVHLRYMTATIGLVIRR